MYLNTYFNYLYFNYYTTLPLASPKMYLGALPPCPPSCIRQCYLLQIRKGDKWHCLHVRTVLLLCEPVVKVHSVYGLNTEQRQVAADLWTLSQPA